jgi:hypothetical protein
MQFRWYLWLAIAFGVAWFFFGLSVAGGICASVWVASRLYKVWKAKRELEEDGLTLKKQIADWLTRVPDDPSSKYRLFVEVLKPLGLEVPREYREGLLRQVESVSSDSSSVALSAQGFAGLKLMKAVDILVALEALENLDRLKEREYLLQIVRKHSESDGLGTGINVAEYESYSAAMIRCRLIVEARQSWFEGEMWAHVAHYAGDGEALRWFEDTATRACKISMDQWTEEWAKYANDDELHTIPERT